MKCRCLICKIEMEVPSEDILNGIVPVCDECLDLTINKFKIVTEGRK